MKRASLVILGAVAVASLSVPVMADVIYCENFPVVKASTNYAFPINGWYCESPATAGSTTPVPTIATGAPDAANNSDTTLPTNISAAVNSGTPAGTVAGRVFVTPPASSVNVILWTNEYTFDVGANAINSFQWYSKSDGAQEQCAAIEINNNWYVSDPQVTGNGSWLLETVNAQTVNWHPLNYVQSGQPGATLDQTISPTVVSLPASGTAQAFGVYFDSVDTQISRVDEFVINATIVPEPASLGMLLGLGALGLLRRRQVA
jgi:hypothetical protein